MVRLPPTSTRTDSLFPYTTLFRSKLVGCLACPGLIVPIDPDHLARIVQATMHLEAARERIDPIRFSLFYAPSLRVLTQDLLPAFPPEMMPDAERHIPALRSEEHTSELQSLMRISYAVFCLKKKTNNKHNPKH